MGSRGFHKTDGIGSHTERVQIPPVTGSIGVTKHPVPMVCTQRETGDEWLRTHESSQKVRLVRRRDDQSRWIDRKRFREEFEILPNAAPECSCKMCRCPKTAGLNANGECRGCANNLWHPGRPRGTGTGGDYSK